MKRFGLGLSIALLALGGMTAGADAQAVKFEGCAVKAFGDVCTLINPLGQSYMVNSATPAVPVNKPIRLTGTAVTGLTMCGVPALTNVKWRPIKKKSC